MVHVYDIIMGGTPNFLENITRSIKMRFKISKDKANKFSNLGMTLRMEENNYVYINQSLYVKVLELITDEVKDNMDKHKLREILRKTAGKMMYLNRTRPELAL